MHHVPFPFQGLVGSFLLAFPALFSIVNPVAGALIFMEVIGHVDLAERHRVAGRVALYSAAILLVSLWAGSYLLNFFGISLGALRLAGGLVVARSAWELLNQPEQREARKEQQALPAREAPDAAFYPLTMPLTTGPGTISVVIALAAERPSAGHGLLAFMLGLSAAALLISAIIWVSYRYADAIFRLVGAGGARVLSRLVAFLLLCIGMQIMVTGVEDLATEFLTAQHASNGFGALG
jgi:multiple antibiotic resistance protein